MKKIVISAVIMASFAFTLTALVPQVYAQTTEAVRSENFFQRIWNLIRRPARVTPPTLVPVEVPVGNTSSESVQVGLPSTATPGDSQVYIPEAPANPRLPRGGTRDATTDVLPPPVKVTTTVAGPLSINEDVAGTWTIITTVPPANTKYAVDWGMGYVTPVQSSPTFTFAYPNPGYYAAKFKVLNQTGSDEKIVYINVVNPSTNIRVIYPNGGENFTQGQQVTVKWQTTSTGKRIIDLTNLDTRTSQTIYRNDQDGGSQQTLVTIPTTATPGKYRLSVYTSYGTDGDDVFDTTDSYFTVSAATNPISSGITVISPSNATWKRGTLQQIKWTSTNLSADTELYISLVREGATDYYDVTSVYNRIRNTGSYNWEVGRMPEGTSMDADGAYWIRICNVARTVCNTTGGKVIMTSGNPTTPTNITVSAQLLPTSINRAGLWYNFAPGVGNINKDGADWNWSMQFGLDGSSKTIKRVTIIHNAGGEVWSTGYSKYLADGTDLYNGREEHPYPLVIDRISERDGSYQQMANDYDKFNGLTGLSVPARLSNNFRLYGQRETPQFMGGKLIVEFTDGTKATTQIAAGPSVPTTPTQVNSLQVVSPNGGETYTRGSQISLAWVQNYNINPLLIRIVSESGGEYYSGKIQASSGRNVKVLPAEAANLPAGKYKIEICDADGLPFEPCDKSNDYFMIALSPTAPEPTVTFTYPAGGEAIRTGNTYIIKYRPIANGEKMKFDLVDGNTGKTSWILNDASMRTDPLRESTVAWSPAADLTPGSNYKIRATLESNGKVIGESRAFTMLAPESYVQVRSPYVNETYTAGETMTIKFEASYFSTGTSFDIKLGKRPLAANMPPEMVSSIASGIQGNSSYTWKIPESLPAATNYVILICPAGASADKCGRSVGFKLNPSPNYSPATQTPDPSAVVSPSLDASGNPISGVSRPNFVANVFYSLGDVMDMVF